MNQPTSITRFAPFLAVVLVLTASFGRARAQQFPSARIKALGGETVAGIIPDTLTDIQLNPAYLYKCQRLTILYGQRRSDEFSLRFPRMTIPYFRSRALSTDPLASRKMSELSLYGIRTGSWRLGISGAWHLDYQDTSTPEYVTSYGAFTITQTESSKIIHDDLHDYRFVLSASSELSAGTAIGVRIGGWQRTDAHDDTRPRLTYYFDFDENENDIYLDNSYYYYEEEKNYDRVSSLFLQAGLLSGEGYAEKSIVLRVSRHEIYSRSIGRDIYSSTNYNPFNDPYRYDYDDAYSRDERSGVLWGYDVAGRCYLPFGIRLFAGGGYEHMTYDVTWFDRKSEYEWREAWEDEEEYNRLSLEFGGEGKYRGFSLFLKAGRTTELRSDLTLTAGMSGYAKLMRSEEDPVALINVYSRIDSAVITFPVERRIRIETEATTARLALPLAIEYEPAPWISIWSGFRIYATYLRERDLLSNIFVGDLLNFLDPSLLDPNLDQERPRSVDDITIDSTASVGLSLHYRDRFFVDLYTGTDVTPDNIANYILDVRYAF